MEHAGCIVTASIAGFFYKGYASVEYNTKRNTLSKMGLDSEGNCYS